MNPPDDETLRTAKKLRSMGFLKFKDPADPIILTPLGAEAMAFFVSMAEGAGLIRTTRKARREMK